MLTRFFWRAWFPQSVDECITGERDRGSSSRTYTIPNPQSRRCFCAKGGLTPQELAELQAEGQHVRHPERALLLVGGGGFRTAAYYQTPSASQRRASAG